MKKQLRQGDAGALNVYVVALDGSDDNEGILLGYSTFPVNYTSNPADDGIVINSNVLPGEAVGSEYGMTNVNRPAPKRSDKY